MKSKSYKLLIHIALFVLFISFPKTVFAATCMEDFTFNGNVCEAKYAMINGLCPYIQDPFGWDLQAQIVGDTCYYQYLPEDKIDEGLGDFNEDEGVKYDPNATIEEWPNGFSSNNNNNNNSSNNTSSNNVETDAGPRNDYNNICNNEGVKDAVLFIGKLVRVAIWVVPLIIIVLGMVDFAKAMMSQDEKAISKATGALIKRVVAGLAVFIIPTVILSLLKTVGITKNAEQSSEYKSCINCLLYPYNNCQPKTTYKGSGAKPGVNNQNQLIK